MHDLLTAAVGLIIFAAIVLLIGCGVSLLWMFFCGSCANDHEPLSADTGRSAVPRHPDPALASEESYWAYVSELARRVGTDGCTWALNTFVACCDEHDLHYVYRYNLLTEEPISKAWADRRFLDCMRRHAFLGYYSPSAYIRYFFVKHFGNHGREWMNDDPSSGSF